MHEIAHIFGAYHTHDATKYTPVIDTCGTSCPAYVAKSATIMSYCQACSGGIGFIEYTFGGKYKGTGDRAKSTSYDRTPTLAGTVSTDPARINAQMWKHVSGLGTCTAVPPVCFSSYMSLNLILNCTVSCIYAPHRPRPQPPCPAGQTRVEVQVTPDSQCPDDTSWSLVNACTNQVVVSGGRPR